MQAFRRCLYEPSIYEWLAGWSDAAHLSEFRGRIECKGKQERVALASVFQTDVLQIRISAFATPTVISGAGRTFWTTLAAATSPAACELLRIDPSDLEVKFRSISDADHRGELLLFDTVPGGAGLVQRIRGELPAVLGAAKEVLKNCPNTIDCGPKLSCYACLRTFGNQLDWQFLSRESPLPWLGSLVGDRSPRSANTPDRSTLIATFRPSAWSRARYTTACPP